MKLIILVLMITTCFAPPKKEMIEQGIENISLEKADPTPRLTANIEPAVDAFQNIVPNTTSHFKNWAIEYLIKKAPLGASIMLMMRGIEIIDFNDTYASNC